MSPGQQVRLSYDPTRVGVLTDRTRDRGETRYLYVVFPGGGEWIANEELEAVSDVPDDPIDLLRNGKLGNAIALRRTLTHIRLNGKLANVVYSMDTTNTDFYAHQFKPVLKFLNSSANGILIADDPKGFYHIISKDTGFDPLLQHLKAKGVACGRSASIEGMPCFKQGSASTIAPQQASNEGKSKPAARSASVEDMVKVAVGDLIKRKTNRPSTAKKLRSTIHARCGKEVPAADIDAVYEALLERGYVKLDGAKLTYALPTVQEAEDGRA